MLGIAHVYVEVLPSRRPRRDLRIVRVDFERKLYKLSGLPKFHTFYAEHERQGAPQESGRRVTAAPLRNAFDKRNDRTDAADHMRCNVLADLVHAGVRQIETRAPDRLRVSAKVEQTDFDLDVLADFRQRQIHKIVEAHAGESMLAHEESGGLGVRRNRGNHVETAEAAERGGDFLRQRKGQILVSLRVAGGKR